MEVAGRGKSLPVFRGDMKSSRQNVNSRWRLQRITSSKTFCFGSWQLAASRQLAAQPSRDSDARDWLAGAAGWRC